MEPQLTAKTDRRSRTRQVIHDLLAERQEMLVAYCRLAGLEPYSGKQPVKEQLEQFCQLLMDYTAFGHFQVYARILDGDERRSKVRQVAERIYAALAELTANTVAFNDKYDASSHPLDLASLSSDLSRLGEQLALRLELEDRLLRALSPGKDLTEPNDPRPSV